MDVNWRALKNLSFFGALAYTDAKYVKFSNAPAPLEVVIGETYKGISGGRLQGVSKWAGSFGGEWFSLRGRFLGLVGQYFVGSELFFRSEFSSGPSPSRFLNIEGYAFVNARTGYRASSGLSFFVWSRNLFDAQYSEQLLPGAGNSGQYAAVLGNPKIFGFTVRFNFLPQ